LARTRKSLDVSSFDLAWRDISFASRQLNSIGGEGRFTLTNANYARFARKSAPPQGFGRRSKGRAKQRAAAPARGRAANPFERIPLG
jgi:hypothetical protein